MTPLWILFSSRIPSSLSNHGSICAHHHLREFNNALSHGLHTNTLFVREEDEDLVHRVVFVVRKEIELGSTRICLDVSPECL